MNDRQLDDSPTAAGDGPLAALAAARRRGRLLLVWADVPFPPRERPPAQPALEIARWQAAAAALPHPPWPLTSLPPLPILSLDPSKRVEAAFRQARIPLRVVRARGDVPARDVHSLLQLGGDLESRAGLFLSWEDVGAALSAPDKAHLLAEAGRAVEGGAVLVLAADPGKVFPRFWRELLAPALQSAAEMYALGPAGFPWPAPLHPLGVDFPALVAALAQAAPPLSESAEAASCFIHGYALVVGVGADLPVTVDDAAGLANLLRDPSRCAYPPEQVRLLTEENARCGDIRAGLDWLAQRARADPDATAVVFFSGHGVETPNYYLLPFGYDLADLPGTAFAGDEFTGRLRGIRARKLLVLLDCCHAGGMAEAKGLPLVKSPAPPGLADALAAGSGRVVIASSRRDEVSYTGRPFSVFTGALQEALAGYGAFERDGYARVLDMTLWVGRRVPERTGDRQHPIVKVSHLEDNFALAYYAGGAKEPRPLPWAAAPSAVAPGLEAAQVEAWQRMLHNYRGNLLLIEERMSEYVEFTDIPLQLIKNKRKIEKCIAELEQRLAG